MRTEKERNRLIRALDALNRKIVVIFKDFCILATAGAYALIGGESPSGKCCHQLLYNRIENHTGTLTIDLPFTHETDKGAEHAAHA